MPRSHRIAFEGVSISASEDAGASVLRAASVVYRNRTTAAGLITYHDIAELLASDAVLSIESNSSDGFSAIPQAMEWLLAMDAEELIVESPKSNELLPAAESRQGASDSATPARLPIVTRLLFEQLAINHSSPTLELSIEANRGRHALDVGALVLEGGVVIRTSLGEEIRAAKAVLSRDHNGLYLPLGYHRNGLHAPQSAFLVLDQDGQLSATRGSRQIAYEDLIAKRERLVILHYAKRAPPALRPLLIAILAGMGSPQP